MKNSAGKVAEDVPIPAPMASEQFGLLSTWDTLDNKMRSEQLP